MTASRICISTSFEDKTSHTYQFYRELVDDLCAAGAEVVVDEVSSADGLAQSLNQVLSSCQWLVLVQTPQALSSPQVQLTVNTALELVAQHQLQGVLRVIVEPCDPREVPATWATITMYDATQDYARALERIKLTLSLVGSSTSPWSSGQTSMASPPLSPLPALSSPLSPTTESPMKLPGSWMSDSSSAVDTPRRLAPKAASVGKGKDTSFLANQPDVPIPLRARPPLVRKATRRWLTFITAAIVASFLIAGMAIIVKAGISQTSMVITHQTPPSSQTSTIDTHQTPPFSQTSTVGTHQTPPAGQTITPTPQPTGQRSTVGTHQTLPAGQTITPTPQPISPDARYVTNLYHDLLGRFPSSAELNYWVQSLGQGTLRIQMASSLLSGTDYHSNLIEADYQQILHRPADASGSSFYVGQLNNGAKNETVLVGLAASDEYFTKRGGGTNSGFVNALYQDLLQRSADPSGESYYVSILNNGVSHATVAQGLVTSTEYRTKLVDEYYSHYLGRLPNSVEQSNAVAILQGNPDETLIGDIVSTDKYYAKP